MNKIRQIFSQQNNKYKQKLIINQKQMSKFRFIIITKIEIIKVVTEP